MAMEGSIGAIFGELKLKADDFVNGLDKAKGAMAGAGASMGTLGKLAGSIGFAAVGAAAFTMAQNMEAAQFTIRRATGATGKALDDLNASFQNVYKTTARSSEEVSAALSKLNVETRLTGKALEELTSYTLKFAKVTGTDVRAAVEESQKVFKQWGILASAQIPAMDKLYRVQELTGIGASKLMGSISAIGPAMRGFGFSFEEASLLIGRFYEKGIDAESMVGALSRGLIALAESGRNPQQVLFELAERIKNAKTELEALNIAMEVFPRRAAVMFVDAVKRGAFDLGDLTQKYKENTDTVKKAADETVTLTDKIKKLGHEAEVFGNKWSAVIQAVGVVGPLLISLGSSLTKLSSVSNIGNAISNIRFALAEGLIPALTTFEKVLLGIGRITPFVAIAVAVELFGLKLIEHGAKPADTATAALKRFNDEARKTPGGMLAVNWGAGGPMPGGSAAQRSQLDAYLEGQKGKVGGPAPPPVVDQAAIDAYLKFLQTIIGVSPGVVASQKDIQNAIALLVKQFHAGTLTAADYATGLGNIAARQWETSNSGKALWLANAKLGTELLHLRKPMEDINAEMNKLALAEVAVTVPLPLIVQQLIRIGHEVLNGIAVSAAKAAAEIEKIAAEIEKMIEKMNKERLAAGSFGLQTPMDEAAAVKAAQENYDIILKAGTYSYNQIAIAALRLEQVEIDAARHAGRITAEEYRKQTDEISSELDALEGRVKVSTQRRAKYEYDARMEMERGVHSAFDSLSRGLAQNIIEWKGWAETIKNVGKRLAEDVYSIFLRSMFKPLENKLAELAGKLGDLLGSVFGKSGGGGSGAGASAGGSVASGAASGAMGIVGAVAGVITAVSSVVGNFQFYGMNKSLDIIVKHTLETTNELRNLRADEWARQGSLFAKLDDIWGSIRSAGSVGGNGVNGITINVYTQTADPRGMAQSIIRELKSMSPAFAG